VSLALSQHTVLPSPSVHKVGNPVVVISELYGPGLHAPCQRFAAPSRVADA